MRLPQSNLASAQLSFLIFSCLFSRRSFHDLQALLARFWVGRVFDQTQGLAFILNGPPYFRLYTPHRCESHSRG